jgi:hypothetical protein
MQELVYYRLEYNEKTGAFESIPFSKRKENVFDWETISMVISQQEIDAFFEYLKKNEPQLNSEGASIYPTAISIKNLYSVFQGLSEM